MIRKVGLLVGNGFTKDFVGSSFNTSKPLSNFNNRSISYGDLFNLITPLIEELKSYEIKTGDDFKAMESFLSSDNSYKECQLRRFLAIAYSKLQFELEKIDKPNWKWLKWISNNKNSLEFAISFNYDLILENTLKKVDFNFFRIGTTELHEGLPILKPHGSIDFDLSGVKIESRKTGFSWIDTASEIIARRNIWTYTTSLNQVNGTVDITPKKHWLLPRFQPDLIPPSQANYHRDLEWIDEGFKLYNQLSKNITDFVMIGHSYSECDRAEIDYFLENLQSRTLVHIVNPVLSPYLEEKLKSLKLCYNHLSDLEGEWGLLQT